MSFRSGADGVENCPSTVDGYCLDQSEVFTASASIWPATTPATGGERASPPRPDELPGQRRRRRKIGMLRASASEDSLEARLVVILPASPSSFCPYFKSSL